jgi:hypothetical protein
MDDGKLLFGAKIDNQAKLCIKLVRRYFKEAHMKCASMGFALRLRGFERLPGGWYMMVMDAIENKYGCFCDIPIPPTNHKLLEDGIISLHQGGFVHGDVRSTNVMVRKDGEPGLILTGPEKLAQYDTP